MLRLASLVAAALMASPAQALAGTVALPVPPSGGPLLTGSSATWAEGGNSEISWSSPGEPITVHAAPPDGPRRTIATFPVPPSGAHFVHTLAASPGRVALVRRVARPSYFMGHVSSWETVGFELWLGTPAGDFHKIDAAYEPEQRCAPSLAALWKDLLLVAHTNCYPDPGASISDLSDRGGPATRIPIPEGARDVKMAGHYIAWFAETNPGGQWKEWLIVYDWVAGKEAYRLDVSPYVVNASITHELQLDLQDDGMIVANLSGEMIWDPGRVIWASVDAPAIHELPVHAGRFDIASHGGLIALRDADARYYAVVDTQANERNVFALTGDRAGPNYLDFDGERLLWAENGVLYNQQYPVAPAAVLPTGSATVDTTGMAKIPVWCSQPKARCYGSVSLRRSGSAATLNSVVGQGRFRIGARNTRAVKVPLTRRARRLLLHRRLTARVTVSTKHGRRGQRVELVRR